MYIYIYIYMYIYMYIYIYIYIYMICRHLRPASVHSYLAVTRHSQPNQNRRLPGEDEMICLPLVLYKIFFYFEALVHESTIVSFPAHTCIAHPGAIVLHDYWAVYDSPSDPPFVLFIQDTILVITISCKGQLTPTRYPPPHTQQPTWHTVYTAHSQHYAATPRYPQGRRQTRADAPTPLTSVCGTHP